jgi:hypothetical protein
MKSSARTAGLRAEIMNPGSPEYEAGVLATLPRHSITIAFCTCLQWQLSKRFLQQHSRQYKFATYVSKPL